MVSRAWRDSEPLARGGAGGRGDGAVTAFAFLVVEEGFEEASAIEIGPERVGDKNFGVGDLPEEEIADAHLAAGSDQQVGIREVGGVEVAREIVLGDEPALRTLVA